MKSLVYEIRDNLITNFERLKKGKERFFNKHYKKTYEVIKNPTVHLAEIIKTAKHLLDDESWFDKTTISERSEKIDEHDELESFHDILGFIYADNTNVKKNYYHFVQDFAKNLEKLKVPNFNKLTINDVFPKNDDDKNFHQYIEIHLEDLIISFLIIRNFERKITHIFYIFYVPSHHKGEGLPKDKRCIQLSAPRLIKQYDGYEENENYDSRKSYDKDIGNNLFLDLVENEFRDGDIQYLINCLLYLQSGDPDIRHMKGENPRKYKINSKDSFFEKRQKQVLSQDAVFNDYELVGWNYKKQYNVAGHWRYQACGPKWSQHKLIFIESFKKGKKND